MKKMFVTLLSLFLCIGLSACGKTTQSAATVDSLTETTPTSTAVVPGSTADGENVSIQLPSAANHKTFKIGILETQLSDESTIRVNYFRDYIAPRYNCEFMFSEACGDLNSVMTYIENAADAGCDAILCYYTVPANTEQLVQLCQEYGMLFIENGGIVPANEAAYKGGYENFGGGFQANQPATGRLFKDYLVATMDPADEHSFLIVSGSCYLGNMQQLEITTNIMEAIAEIYGLTYEKTINELITSSSPIQAVNDKDIEIYCYPGLPTASGWLEGLSAALQTGKYDYLLIAPNAIGNIGNAVSEVESALDKDITIIGFGTFGTALTNAFNTKDKFGNQSVSMSTVKFTSLVSAMAFSKAYNMLTGHPEAVLTEDGNTNVLQFKMESVTSAEQLAQMSDWDVPGKWVADYDIVDQMLVVNEPGLTAKEIQERTFAVNYESIKKRRSD